MAKWIPPPGNTTEAQQIRKRNFLKRRRLIRQHYTYAHLTKGNLPQVQKLSGNIDNDHNIDGHRENSRLLLKLANEIERRKKAEDVVAEFHEVLSEMEVLIKGQNDRIERLTRENNLLKEKMESRNSESDVQNAESEVHRVTSVRKVEKEELKLELEHLSSWSERESHVRKKDKLEKKETQGTHTLDEVQPRTLATAETQTSTVRVDRRRALSEESSSQVCEKLREELERRQIVIEALKLKLRRTYRKKKSKPAKPETSNLISTTPTQPEEPKHQFRSKRTQTETDIGHKHEATLRRDPTEPDEHLEELEIMRLKAVNDFYKCYILLIKELFRDLFV